VRGVLECDDRAAAHAYLASVPHASGQNYLIGDSVGIADYECSAAGIRNSL
jgi:predicted choloylglycine hydrolase